MFKSKKKIISFIFIVVIVLSFFMIFNNLSKKDLLNEYKVVSPKVEDIKITSVASGKIISNNNKTYQIESNNIEYKAEVGSFIKKDDLLISYYNNVGKLVKIKADFDGIVSSFTNDYSNTITLSDINKLALEVQIIENEITKIKENQDSTIYVEALEQEFKGKVVKINQIGNTKTDYTMYPVLIELTETNPNLMIGMTASVKIETNSKKDALIIDRDCLIIKNNKYYVLSSKWLDDNSKEQSDYYIEVEVGLVDIDKVEIISGLNKDDKILLFSKDEAVTFPFVEGRND